MKRFTLLIAVVLAGMASQASAAPGDAEMDAWRARWMDADFYLVFRYNPNTFHSDLAEDGQCRSELYIIMRTYPGTAAADEASKMTRFWGFMRKRGIGDTTYVPDWSWLSSP